jgi:hypothetical protein
MIAGSLSLNASSIFREKGYPGLCDRDFSGISSSRRCFGKILPYRQLFVEVIFVTKFFCRLLRSALRPWRLLKGTVHEISSNETVMKTGDFITFLRNGKA